nr:hypothetical protein [Tanacetum cinerariifolium]
MPQSTPLPSQPPRHRSVAHATTSLPLYPRSHDTNTTSITDQGAFVCTKRQQQGGYVWFAYKLEMGVCFGGQPREGCVVVVSNTIGSVFLEGTPVRGTYSLQPGVLGGDTCEGYIFISARVLLEETPMMGTHGFHYCPSVLGGDTYDGVKTHTHMLPPLLATVGQPPPPPATHHHRRHQKTFLTSISGEPQEHSPSFDLLDPPHHSFLRAATTLKVTTTAVATATIHTTTTAATTPQIRRPCHHLNAALSSLVFLEGTPTRGTYSLQPGALGGDTCEGYIFISARVLLEETPMMGTHGFHYCPSVLGGDTCEGYIFISARVLLEETPMMGTHGFHYCPSVLGGDTYDGYLVHRFHELRVIVIIVLYTKEYLRCLE